MAPDAWRDSRNTATTGTDIYAARITSAGMLPVAVSVVEME